MTRPGRPSSWSAWALLLVSLVGCEPRQAVPGHLFATPAHGPTVRPLASTGDDPDSERSPGFLAVVASRHVLTIVAENAGRLVTLAARVSDRVERGQILARIEAEGLRSAVEQAEAELAAARWQQQRMAWRLESSRDRARRRELYRELYPAEELMAARSAAEEAQADLASAELHVTGERTRVEQLHREHGGAVVRAPIAGSVTARLAEPGAALASGTALLRLASTDDLIIRFAAPPAALALLHAGEAVELRIASPLLLAQGHLLNVPAQVDMPSQTVFVEAAIDRSSGPLHDGLIGRVTIADRSARTSH
jgi:RND family efflux transporter MFP subunit